MLIVFPPVFVVETKLIYGYNFVAPLAHLSKSFILQTRLGISAGLFTPDM